ncbi:putative WD repeat-containing protein [Wickerhamomyces ciferrii]|uniref:Peroxin-7 n=1 Tax=Wickerhamomyces ciferrii (strain ATCC 14091 / BCRC 22168 / CBS 111 / JCM 3599 / NBRC 0793 / NRRL Y-1031 F-60-10) TaxID=1206466 RepID=K0KV48_WICCF|nr:putative WD repeat-containing protein [Wickerhamomyces ciferrii]CCH45048.1 putative WD repeat-containing protein [Wickerhamomyces ciferrii]
MLSFRTKGYNGYGVKYSPFYDNKLAVATSSNYGLVGNGRLYILSINPDGQIVNDVFFDTQDGLFDLAWSEVHENHVATANGDGSIKIFDIGVSQFPILQLKEHRREVFSINWNMNDKSTFVSSSWDGTIKLWTPSRKQSLATFNAVKPHAQNNCVYQTVFSPHNPSMLVSANANSHIQVWDTRSPNPNILDFIGHGGAETLTCDWNKYRPTVIATAGVDKNIKIWDLRMIDGTADFQSPHQNKLGPAPLNQLIGHDFAIRRVVWSPHDGGDLLSCSYDMTSRVWKDQADPRTRGVLNNRFQKNSTSKIFGMHKEFVIGGDYSLWGDPGWVATTGWDEMVYIYDSKRL